MDNWIWIGGLSIIGYLIYRNMDTTNKYQYESKQQARNDLGNIPYNHEISINGETYLAVLSGGQKRIVKKSDWDDSNIRYMMN